MEAYYNHEAVIQTNVVLMFSMSAESIEILLLLTGNPGVDGWAVAGCEYIQVWCW